MRARTSAIVCLALAAPALGALFAGCFSSAQDCTQNLSCTGPTTTDGSVADAADGGSPNDSPSPDSPLADGTTPDAPGVDAGPCDATADPALQPCVIDERFGVFVSPTGTASGPGTRAAPYNTIGGGMRAAKAAGKRVYVCNGVAPYDEQILVDSTLDGLSVYGGFACTDWSYSTANKAQLWSTKQGIALTVSKLAVGLRVQDVSVQVPDATAAGASSIAVFVDVSAGVVFNRVAMASGLGATGAIGSTGADGTAGAAPTSAQQGAAAVCQNPPPFLAGGTWGAGASACGSVGGMGGNSYLARAGADGASGEPGANNAGTGSGAAGAPGSPGGPGTSGTAGAYGAAALAAGVFTEGIFTQASGGDGAAGSLAQGGGGGGASSSAGSPTCDGASGGAGGLGGCGGQQGTGGGGGGASVALFSWSSTVTLQACTLTSKNGGNGGNGGNAGYGGRGGQGALGGAGAGASVGAGGNGGLGGNGGNGGAGAGGTGGPSYAIVNHGAAPSMGVDTILTHGAGGAHGTGGAHALDPLPKAPDGSDGDASNQHVVP